MKILEELKAAQAIIDKAKSNDWDTPNGFLKLEGEHWAIDISSMDEDHIRNVLRRIPQLIEVVGWIERVKIKPEKVKNYEHSADTSPAYGTYLDGKVMGQHVTIEYLLSKLEDEKDGD